MAHPRREVQMDEPPIRVLIVDDEEETYLITRDLLSQIDAQRFDPDWAADYTTARQAIGRHRYDVCLLDDHLVEQNGGEPPQKALGDGSQVPVIVLTEQEDHRAGSEALQAGAADFLVKGQLDPPLLERSIRYALERARLMEMLEDHEQLDQARHRFVGSIAHELRAPVTNLRLYARLLRTGRCPEKSQHYIRILEEQSARLSDMVQDILEMMALVEGDGAAFWEKVELSNVIGSVVTCYRNQAEEAGVSLVEEPLPQDLPTVEGDSGRLTQALGELVENALLFSSSGSQVTLETRAIEEAGRLWVRVAVQDTGPGIAPEEQAHIFDRFYRGSAAAARDLHGSGLGLCIVKEITRAHGGRVTVTSELGHGSTFALWLPEAGRQTSRSKPRDA